MDASSPESLQYVLDILDEARLYDLSLPTHQKESAARWLAARPFSAVGMPSPTRYDYEHGVRLFTGEKLHTRLAVNHVLGVEACRNLLLLDIPGAWGTAQAQRAINAILQACFARQCVVGECAIATVALWRLLATGAIETPAECARRMREGLAILAAHRDSRGRWQRFPFYYTLLALLEMPTDLVAAELQYALPACGRRRRVAADAIYEARRKHIIARVYARCGVADSTNLAPEASPAPEVEQPKSVLHEVSAPRKGTA